MNNSSLICSTIRMDWTFMFFTISIFLANLFSLIANSFIYFVLTRSHSLPSNVNLLLRNVAIALSLISSYSLGKCVYNTYVFSFGFAPNTRFICGLSEAPAYVAVGAFVLSIFAIGIDRLINTIFKSKYVDRERPSTLARCFAVSIWTLSLIGVCLFNVTTWMSPHHDETMCYCSNILSEPLLFSFALCPSFIVLEIFTITCYLLVYRYSRSAYLDFTINTTQHSLSQRFQMISNVRTTILLMPTILIHGTTYVITSIAVAYLGFVIKDEGETRYAINYVSMVHMITSIEGFVHPIFLFSKHEQLLKAGAKYSSLMKYFFDKLTTKNALIADAKRRSRETGGERLQKFRMSALPTSNKITNGVVNFRIKPDQNHELLSIFWAKK